MKYDVIAFSVSFLLILAYYLYLGRRTRRAPDSSVHRLNARVRERWVDLIMTHDNMTILAIQTLRNSVMAANFMASTSILLIIGTIQTNLRLFKQGWQILYLWYTRILFRLADRIMVFRPLYTGSRHTWINRWACHTGQGAKLSLRLS
jgi:hypothetical protein